MQAEFTDLVGENSPFLSALLKVYKKKAGQPAKACVQSSWTILGTCGHCSFPCDMQVKRSKRKKGMGEEEDMDEDEEDEDDEVLYSRMCCMTSVTSKLWTSNLRRREATLKATRMRTWRMMMSARHRPPAETHICTRMPLADRHRHNLASKPC